MRHGVATNDGQKTMTTEITIHTWDEIKNGNGWHKSTYNRNSPLRHAEDERALLDEDEFKAHHWTRIGQAALHHPRDGWTYALRATSKSKGFAGSVDKVYLSRLGRALSNDEIKQWCESFRERRVSAPGKWVVRISEVICSGYRFPDVQERIWLMTCIVEGCKGQVADLRAKRRYQDAQDWAAARLFFDTLIMELDEEAWVAS